ncbi:TetR/AcrR family transcriptional regulator [Nocardia sp. NPDC057227]|uniref:TetR/AcrR family transcriptional regulator n=1 Tax=Nocardia sp. NPDC057227 TaxID=3346056 RepID=UPI00362FCDA9
MGRAETGTRERILTSAERLLLEAGYDRVSVRAVCAAAGLNPAAVHYHFGSKEALVAALLEARLGPLWQTTLDDLAVGSPDVRAVVTALIAPLAELAADPTGRLYLHLLARLVLGRRPVRWAATWFRLDPWVALLRDLVPGLNAATAKRRWLLAFDLVLGQFGDPLAGDRVLSPAAVAALTAFVSAGLALSPEEE